MHTDIRTFIGLAAIATVGLSACNRDHSKDAALGTDLTLAAQQQHSLDSISAVDSAEARSSRTVVRHEGGDVEHRTTTTTTTTSNGSVVTEKNTNRDAAIGAAAGAILGVTTSHNKVQGGVIGGVVGGVLGGVVGNNVDVKKIKPPQ